MSPLGYHHTAEAKAKIGAAHLGEKNYRWRGDNVAPAQGRRRARKWYPLEPCEVCGSLQSERHHRDSNPVNNEAENIAFVCRKHHLALDARMQQLHLNNRGKIRSVEERIRIGNMNKDRIWSAESRAKLGRATKARHAPRGSDGRFLPTKSQVLL